MASALLSKPRWIAHRSAVQCSYSAIVSAIKSERFTGTKPLFAFGINAWKRISLNGYGCGTDKPRPDKSPNIVLYDYQDGRGGVHPAAFLADYCGPLQVDG